MFDAIKTRDEALLKKIKRAELQARAGHPDFKINHANEFRDAQKKDYTELKLRVTREFNKYQVDLKRRKDKLGRRI